MCIICESDFNQLNILEIIDCNECDNITKIPVLTSLLNLGCSNCENIHTIPVLQKLERLQCNDYIMLTHIPDASVGYSCNGCLWLEKSKDYNPDNVAKVVTLQLWWKRLLFYKSWYHLYTQSGFWSCTTNQVAEATTFQ